MHRSDSRPSRRPSAVGALLAAAAACTLAAGGCGYALVGRVSTLPEDIRSVYIEPFANATSRSQVDQILSAAVSDEMVTRQRLRVVANRATADAELGGRVTGFRVVPVAFDDAGRADTYEVRISASVIFRRVGGGEVVWTRDNYQFREDYEIDVAESAFFDREILALEEVADEFAETLVTDLFEGF